MYSRKDVIEGYKGVSTCPNLLVKKEGKYLLINTNAKQIPGVNPIEFKSLDEYSKFNSNSIRLHCKICLKNSGNLDH